MKFVKQIYALSLLFAASSVGGCAVFNSSQAEVKPKIENKAKTKEDKRMKIQLGEISFDVPSGFPAPRGYQEPGQTNEYEKGSQFSTVETNSHTGTIAESLEVGNEFESNKTLSEIASEVKENMQNTGVYKIERETEITVDGYPANVIVASAKNEGEAKIYAYVVHIKSGDHQLLRIYYDTERNAADSQAVFDHIISSVKYNRSEGGKPKTPAPENYRRYDAGDVSLEVPATMKPTKSEKITRLRIEQFPDQTWNAEQIVYTAEFFSKENVGSRNNLISEVEKFQNPDAITGRETDSFDTGQLKGESSRLTLIVPTLENAEGKTAVSLAEGRTKDGTFFQLKGESPFSKRGEMESGFREILTSVKTETPNDE